MASSLPSLGLLDVVDIAGIGVEIYAYLQAEELCRVSLCGRALLDNVGGVRHRVLRTHLPIHLEDDATKDTITLAEGRTFAEKAELRAFLVEKFDAAGILVRETHTRQQSIERARYLLNYQNWCHLTLPDHTFNALAECHVDEVNPEYAARMIGWNDCRGVADRHPAAHRFATGWARYLLAQPEARCSRWNWLSNHPKLRHKSVRGTGIVMATPGGEEVELRWDKKFKLAGSIFDSNLHRRQPRE